MSRYYVNQKKDDENYDPQECAKCAINRVKIEGKEEHICVKCGDVRPIHSKFNNNFEI